MSLLWLLALSLYHVSAVRYSSPSTDEVFTDNSDSFCDSTCSLKIQHELSNVPHNFLHSPSLNCLDFSNNSIASVDPNMFGGLPNLKYANFKGSNFDHNPFLTTGHSELEVLDLSDNEPPNLTYKVSVTGDFPKLRRLYFTRSRLVGFEASARLSSLTHLDLGDTYIVLDDFKTLPPSLEYLNLRNSLLGTLTIRHLIRLKWLWVSVVDKSLESVELDNLSELEYLSLPSCGISDPSKISLNNTPSLTYADFSGNLFPEFDLRLLDSAKNLRYLNLGGNSQLTSINPSPDSSISEIDVSGSPVTSYDWLPNSVEKMSLRNSNLVDVKSICTPSETSDSTRASRCPNLNEIDLSGNNIDSVDNSTFQNMENLRSLNLSANAIQKVEPDSFDSLGQLQYLNLGHNYIVFFPQVSGKSQVELLLLNGNRLETIKDDTFINLNNLRYLFLRNNSIAEIEPRAFFGLNALEILDLSFNYLSQFPEGWSTPLESLQILDLSGNRFLSLSGMHLNRESPLENLYVSCPLPTLEFFAIKDMPVNATMYMDVTPEYVQTFAEKGLIV